MNGHRVDVDTGDGEAQPFEHLLGIERGIPSCFDEVCDGLGDESAGAAGRVEDALVQWVGYNLADHRAGEPVGV